MYPLTAKRLLQFASTLEGENLTTRAQQAAFSVCVVPDGLEITPASSGTPRVVRREKIQSVLDEYARTESNRTTDYLKVTFNSSYLLALINLYIDVGMGSCPV